MRDKQRMIVILTVWAMISCSWFLYGGKSAYNFPGYLPKVEKQANSLKITIDTLKKEKDFYIYYRTAGLKKYQVRKMKLDKAGNVYYQLSTENLYGDVIEYFIVEEAEGADSVTTVFTIDKFTDNKSPEIYFQEANAPGGGATGSGSKFSLPFKIGASLSSVTQIRDKSDFPGHKFDANGNIRLYRNIVDDKHEFDFDTNVAYMHHPSDTESKFNLSDMKVRFKSGAHTFAAGDLAISNTEFTTSFLNRRGLRYEMSGKTLYLASFFTNSQQKTGFDGFGLPPSDSNLFGAAAGVNIGTNIKIRGLFLTGKDNLDSKTVVSSDDVYREGRLFSVWGEMSLLKSHLTLKGEFARSTFGRGADSASIAKDSGSAWRAEADANYGVVTAHVDYKKVEQTFNSIANLFLQNDREGLAGNIGLMIKSFNLNVRYTDQKTNVVSLVQPMLHTRNMGTGFTWLVANHVQLGAEFSLDNLDYDKSSGLLVGSEDMDTIRYAATLGYIAGSNGITVRVGKTESKTFTSNIDGSVALNLRLGTTLSLNPTLSYQSTENFTDNSTSRIYNAYLNGELVFIPEFFSLSVSSSWSKNENTFGDTTTLTAEGNLNLSMAKFFKHKLQPTLSLKSKYESYKTGGITTDNLTLYLQADISF